MEILKIIQQLQSYSEDVVAENMGSDFARAVTEAVSLLISQGERIAELESEVTNE
jgi:hypothetical protein